jgi:tetratricopeptide (TPR) repeat protein
VVVLGVALEMLRQVAGARIVITLRQIVVLRHVLAFCRANRLVLQLMLGWGIVAGFLPVGALAQATAPKAPPSQALIRAAELMKQAEGAFQRGDFASAAEHFRQVLRLFANDARAHFGLGLSLASLGKNEDAYPELVQANRLSPGNPEILMALAQMETSLGKLELARQRLAKAERLQPKDPRIGLLNVQTYLAENQTRIAVSKVGEISKASTDLAVQRRVRAHPRAQASACAGPARPRSLVGGARPKYSFSGLFNFANDTPILEEINTDPRTGGPSER